MIVFRQSFYRETAYRKFQKTTKKSRHRIHQKNLIRQRNQTHRKSRVHQKKPDTSEKPEESQPGGTESGGNSTTDSEQPKDDVTENSYAKQVLKLVNTERKKAGLTELTWDDTVATAAMTRSKEIEKSFSHTRPDGRNFGTAITDLGITYRGAGENIAWGQKTPEAVMNAWMNSEGHRANILNPNFKKLGVGYRTDSQRTPYWTQLFTY